MQVAKAQNCLFNKTGTNLGLLPVVTQNKVCSSAQSLDLPTLGLIGLFIQQMMTKSVVSVGWPKFVYSKAQKKLKF